LQYQKQKQKQLLLTIVGMDHIVSKCSFNYNIQRLIPEQQSPLEGTGATAVLLSQILYLFHPLSQRQLLATGKIYPLGIAFLFMSDRKFISLTINPVDPILHQLEDMAHTQNQPVDMENIPKNRLKCKV
jgi:hypothetical protein